MSADRVTACGPPNWVPTYTGPIGARGNEVKYWELVDPIQHNGVHFGTRYTGFVAFPDGRLLLAYHEEPIQCTSVEEAKELGVTTYLLTKKGE
jgi:hypothetical protein